MAQIRHTTLTNMVRTNTINHQISPLGSYLDVLVITLDHVIKIKLKHCMNGKYDLVCVGRICQGRICGP